MFEIRLMNEYFHGPIWVDPSVFNEKDFAPQEQYDRILKDPILNKLNREEGELYDGCLDWHDPGNSPIELKRERRPKMLQLLRAIRIRLHELSDGSFWIHDCEIGTKYCDIDWDHPDMPDDPKELIVEPAPPDAYSEENLKNLLKLREIEKKRQRAYFDHHR